MNSKQIIKRIPEEQTCKEIFKKIRDEKEVDCPKCGSSDHYWLKTREQYKCKNCGHRIPLRSGTLLHSTKLPFRYWFIGLDLVMDNDDHSLTELQKLLGHKYYSPIWKMVSKLRKALEYYRWDTESNTANKYEILTYPSVDEAAKQKKVASGSKILGDVTKEELESQYFVI